MSAIYFHTESGKEVRLRGSERAWMGILCSDIMMAAFGDLYHAKDWILPFLPLDSYVRKLSPDQFERSLRTYLRSADGELIANDQPIDTFILALNTAFAIGGDTLRLMARLHGQCEVHCWIDGPNRKWIYDIIAEGRRNGLYRGKEGWEEVAALMVESSTEPVVCSYSVCESFPNYGTLPDDHPLKQEEGEERYDKFYDLPRDEAWAACMKGLRAQGRGLEIRPDNWDDFYFTPNVNAFTLRRMLSADQSAAVSS